MEFGVLELGLLIALVVAAAKAADNDGQSGLLWGSVALLFGLAGLMFVPLPFLRILGAGLVTLIAYVGYRIVANR